MIDKTKYLYWLNNSEEPSSEVVWREMYTRIGYILHVIQMIEYNIANIMAIEEFQQRTRKIVTIDDYKAIHKIADKKYNKLCKLTFGQLANEVKESEHLLGFQIDGLERVVKYRNYLVHKCFKEKLVSGDLKEIESVDKFVDELNEYEEVIVNLNNWLVQVFKEKNLASIFMYKPDDIF